MQRDHLTADQFDELSIEDFGKPCDKEEELAADREGLKLAVAAGYSTHGAIELLEVYQFLSPDAKPAPRKGAPSLEERIQQAHNEIKIQRWGESKSETPLKTHRYR